MRYPRLWLELLALTWRRIPRLATVVLVLRLVGTVSFVAIALGMRETVAASQRGALHAALLGAVGTAIAYAGDNVIQAVGFNLRMQAVERVGITDLDTDIVRRVCEIESIDHLQDRELLDRVTVLRGAGWGLMDSAWVAIEAVLNIVRLGLCLLLLGTVDPRLLTLLGFALVSLWFDGRGRRAVRDAEIATAESLRVERHLFDVCVKADSGKEIRISGAAPELLRRRGEAWHGATRARLRAQSSAAAWKFAGWTVFTAGFAGALVLVVHRAAGGPAGVAQVVLAVTVATNLRSVVNQAVARSSQTAGYGRLIEPYLWLREYMRTEGERSGEGRPAPDRLDSGIELRGVTFTYPGASSPALADLDVSLSAGSVVAVVGEYGSGKSTLARLLCRLHSPDVGEVLVDGIPLSEIDARAWWSATSVAFQDFGRYRGPLRESVGLGDVTAIDDTGRLLRALDEADAASLLDRLPDGLGTGLGREFGGVELSEGQWQKTALARACLRERPLLFVLDEPTASLDAPSERAVFEHYFTRARALARAAGAITVIVSHRFSTVSGADLILVLERGRLAQAGTHEELMSRPGTYGDLYAISSSAYSLS